MAETRIGDFVSVVRDGAIATVTMDRGDQVSMLEIDVEVPNMAGILTTVGANAA